MIGPRDIGWGIVLGVLLVALVQSYPLWSAERMVKGDAEDAFEHVFEGRRMIDGDLIKPEGSPSAPITFSPPIYFRYLDVVAEHIDWNGKHVELLLRHVVGFDKTLDEMNPTHEVLVKLEKQMGSFVYTQFQVRGQPPTPVPVEGNPWFVIMQAAIRAEHPSDAAPDKLKIRGAERIE